MASPNDEGWTLVQHRRVRNNRKPKPQNYNPPPPRAYQELQQGLPRYAGGRFKSVEEARDNVLLNMLGGLSEDDLSPYEAALVAYDPDA
jgi:hypothetical protein